MRNYTNSTVTYNTSQNNFNPNTKMNKQLMNNSRMTYGPLNDSRPISHHCTCIGEYLESDIPLCLKLEKGKMKGDNGAVLRNRKNTLKVMYL